MRAWYERSAVFQPAAFKIHRFLEIIVSRFIWRGTDQIQNIFKVDVTAPDNNTAPEENNDDTTAKENDNKQETDQLNVTSPPHLEQK